MYLYWTNVPLRKIYCIILYLSITACIYPREKLSPATISTVIEMRYPFSDFPNALVASIKWSFKDSPGKNTYQENSGNRICNSMITRFNPLMFEKITTILLFYIFLQQKICIEGHCKRNCLLKITGRIECPWIEWDIIEFLLSKSLQLVAKCVGETDQVGNL